MDPLLLATTQSDYVTPWWPLWSAWLLAALGLIFVGRPTLTQRVFGVALLAAGLFLYGWEVYFHNGCIEGYAGWTSCNVSGVLILLGVVLFAGSALIALWRLLRRLRRR